MNRYARFTITALFSVFFPDGAYAFQPHAHPEGLYAHQMAHVFFVFAMWILVYRLQSDGFVQERGWRYIQTSCVLFAIWNIVAFCGHYVEERMPSASVSGDCDWTQQIHLDAVSWAPVYYVLKLDHMICVPAMVMLWLGLRNLVRDAQAADSASRRPDPSQEG